MLKTQTGFDLIEREDSRKVVKTEKSFFEITLDRSNGLWSIKPATGPVPRKLSGRYTTSNAAESSIKAYLSAKSLATAITKD